MKTLATCLLALMAALLTACGEAPQPTATPPGPAVELLAAIPSPFTDDPQVDKTFVGQLAGTPTYVAVVASGGQAVGFFCDGNQVWGWLTGRVDGDRITLAGKDGAELSATLADDRVNGTLTSATDGLAGAAFQAHLAGPDEGLFRANTEHDGRSYVLGWILTSDGVRGLEQDEFGGTKNAVAADTTSTGGSTSGGSSGSGQAAVRSCQSIKDEIAAVQARADQLAQQQKTKAVKETLARLGGMLINLNQELVLHKPPCI